MSNFLGVARKFVIAASGAVSEAVAVGLLHGTPERWVTGVVAVVSAALVYLVPNDKKKEPVDFPVKPVAPAPEPDLPPAAAVPPSAA